MLHSKIIMWFLSLAATSPLCSVVMYGSADQNTTREQTSDTPGSVLDVEFSEAVDSHQSGNQSHHAFVSINTLLLHGPFIKKNHNNNI